MSKPCCALALVGPTASGKSALALALAQRLDAEIISVDSALVYRGMDIGTAKPSAAERARVPHHLIDIRDPDEPYSAAEFARDARQLIADITRRGRRPLLVGGTMLYLKALLQPLAELPPAQPALRAHIDAQAQSLGWPALHAQLAQVDPPTAQRLSPNDSQRIGRALEVWLATGKPLSHWIASAHPVPATATPPLSIPLLSLEPTDRAWLHARIAQRFEAMLAQGLLAEVHRLMQRPELHPELPALRTVGYRQAWQALLPFRERPTLATEALPPPIVQSIRERGIAATRQLAKRQLTWLRSLPQRTVIACDQPDPLPDVLGAIKRLGV